VKQSAVFPADALYGFVHRFNVKRSAFSDSDTPDVRSNLFAGSDNRLDDVARLKSFDFFLS
jgi:hypothetical protein